MTAATLACGLKAESRIVMKLAGLNVSQNTLLQAMAVDALNWLVWSKTKDGEKNRRRPKSITDILQNARETQQQEYDVFNTPEEFEKARRELLERK